MLSEEALKILVPFISAVLVAFITFFLTRSHYEKKRKDDLEDRDFNRHASVYDMRIKEARDYVDKLDAYVNMLGKFSVSTTYFFFLEKDKIKGLDALMEELDSSLSDMSLFSKEIKGGKSSLTILNDNELIDLHKAFKGFVFPIMDNMWGILGKIKTDNVDAASNKIPKDELIALGKASTDMDKIVTKMKIRLDELSRTVR